MAALTLTLDMSDPLSVIDYMAKAMTGWSDAQKAALGRDLSKLFDDDDVLDVNFDTGNAAHAVLSPAFLDVLSRHGLDG